MPGYTNLLKPRFRSMSALQAAVAPLRALQGVDQRIEAALAPMGLRRVLDLAESPIFNSARVLLEGATSSRSVLHRLGSVPATLINEAMPPRAAVAAPLESLQGVGTSHGPTLTQATGAKTVGEMAQWPPFLAARSILAAAAMPPSIAKNLPRKARLLLSRAGQSRPLPGLQVECVAILMQRRSEDGDQAPGEAPASWRHSLGMLVSDHVGYVSFDLQPLRGALAQTQTIGLAALDLIVAQSPDIVIDLAAILVADPFTGMDPALAARVIPIAISPIPAAVAGGTRGMPAIQNADIDDWRLSPYSFSMATLPAIGADGCEVLLPSNLPARTTHYYEIIRDGSIEAHASTDHAYKLAQLAEYQTVWLPLGHGLGDVLYSLTLAPGEATRMAVLDWGRDESNVRTESTTADEDLMHGMRRDRTVDEVADAAIREYQRGESFQGGTAGVGGYGGQGSGSMWGVTGSHAVGYASASSEGERTVAAQNAQRLADAMAQASHAVRSLRSTVVVQATQTEKAAAQTRFVRNYNHSHAMTVLYYQVVRHYLLTTRVSRWRDVILLRRPLPEFAQIVQVTRPGEVPGWMRAAQRHADVLRAALLDKSLADEIDLLSETNDEAEELRFLTDARLANLLIEVSTGDDNADHDRVRFSLMGDEGSVVTWELSNPSGRSTMPHLVGWNTDTYESNSTTVFFLDPSQRPVVEPIRGAMTNFAPTNIVAAIVSFNAEQAGQTWTLKRIRVTATFRAGERSRRVFLVDGPADPWRPTNDSDLVFSIAAPDISGLQRSAADRAARLERLRQHLYQHRMYYSAAVWLATDPNALLAELEAVTWPSGTAAGRLSDFIDPIPLGVFGSYVAYPLGAWRPAEPSGAEVQRLASLPTRGAFAEAQLSHCNASEIIDDTRFWDWQISPIPDGDQAPEIEPVSTASRARELGLAPTLPPISLGIENPEAAPAPSSLASILDAITKSEIFRDMSKAEHLAAILQELTKAAASVEQERMKGLVELDNNKTELETERLRARSGRAGEGGTRPPTEGENPVTSPTPATGTGTQRVPLPDTETRPTAREIAADIQTVERHEPDPEARRQRARRILDRVARAGAPTRQMRFEFVDGWGRPARGVYAVEITDDDRGHAPAGSATSDISGNHVYVPVSENLHSATIRIRVQSVSILSTGDLDSLWELFGGGSTMLAGSEAFSLSVEGETRLAVLDPDDRRSYDFYVTFATRRRQIAVSAEAELRATLEGELGLRILSVRRVGEVSVGGNVQTTFEYVWPTGALQISQGGRPAGS